MCIPHATKLQEVGSVTAVAVCEAKDHNTKHTEGRNINTLGLN